MNPSNPQTVEQILFERMGVTVDDAVATGTDFVDETVARAVESGVDVDTRLAEFSRLFEKATEPSTLTALGQLLDALPQLANMAKLAEEFPALLATVGDVIDDYQQRFAASAIDVEKAVVNGLKAVLYLGTQVDMEHLRRIGDLLASDILNPNALNVVDNAAKSLNAAQEQVCRAASDRIGMLGLLKALRDPRIQRSLAFAVQFGKCFGGNIDTKQP